MRIPFDFHAGPPHFLSRVPSISRELAFIVAALALLLVCAGVLAQPLPGSTNPAATPPAAGPDKAPGPNAVDCTKAANKSLAECSQDSVGRSGLSRNPPGGADRGIQRDAPRANDGMSGPNTGAAPRPSDISDGKPPAMR